MLFFLHVCNIPSKQKWCLLGKHSITSALTLLLTKCCPAAPLYRQEESPGSGMRGDPQATPPTPAALCPAWQQTHWHLPIAFLPLSGSAWSSCLGRWGPEQLRKGGFTCPLDSWVLPWEVEV